MADPDYLSSSIGGGSSPPLSPTTGGGSGGTSSFSPVASSGIPNPTSTVLTRHRLRRPKLQLPMSLVVLLLVIAVLLSPTLLTAISVVHVENIRQVFIPKGHISISQLAASITERLLCTKTISSTSPIALLLENMLSRVSLVQRDMLYAGIRGTVASLSTDTTNTASSSGTNGNTGAGAGSGGAAGGAVGGDPPVTSASPSSVSSTVPPTSFVPMQSVVMSSVAPTVVNRNGEVVEFENPFPPGMTIDAASLERLRAMGGPGAYLVPALPLDELDDGESNVLDAWCTGRVTPKLSKSLISPTLDGLGEVTAILQEATTSPNMVYLPSPLVPPSVWGGITQPTLTPSVASTSTIASFDTSLLAQLQSPENTWGVFPNGSLTDRIFDTYAHDGQATGLPALTISDIEKLYWSAGSLGGSVFISAWRPRPDRRAGYSAKRGGQANVGASGSTTGQQNSNGSIPVLSASMNNTYRTVCGFSAAADYFCPSCFPLYAVPTGDSPLQYCPFPGRLRVSRMGDRRSQYHLRNTSLYSSPGSGLENGTSTPCKNGLRLNDTAVYYMVRCTSNSSLKFILRRLPPKNRSPMFASSSSSVSAATEEGQWTPPDPMWDVLTKAVPLEALLPQVTDRSLTSSLIPSFVLPPATFRFPSSLAASTGGSFPGTFTGSSGSGSKTTLPLADLTQPYTASRLMCKGGLSVEIRAIDANWLRWNRSIAACPSVSNAATVEDLLMDATTQQLLQQVGTSVAGSMTTAQLRQMVTTALLRSDTYDLTTAAAASSTTGGSSSTSPASTTLPYYRLPVAFMVSGTIPVFLPRILNPKRGTFTLSRPLMVLSRQYITADSLRAMLYPIGEQYNTRFVLWDTNLRKAVWCLASPASQDGVDAQTAVYGAASASARKKSKSNTDGTSSGGWTGISDQEASACDNAVRTLSSVDRGSRPLDEDPPNGAAPTAIASLNDFIKEAHVVGGLLISGELLSCSRRIPDEWVDASEEEEVPYLEATWPSWWKAIREQTLSTTIGGRTNSQSSSTGSISGTTTRRIRRCSATSMILFTIRPINQYMTLLFSARGQLVVAAFSIGIISVIMMLILMRSLMLPLRTLTRAVLCCATLKLERIEQLESSNVAEISSIQKSVSYLAVRLYHYAKFLPDRVVALQGLGGGGSGNDGDRDGDTNGDGGSSRSRSNSVRSASGNRSRSSSRRGINGTRARQLLGSDRGPEDGGEIGIGEDEVDFAEVEDADVPQGDKDSPTTGSMASMARTLTGSQRDANGRRRAAGAKGSASAVDATSGPLYSIYVTATCEKVVTEKLFTRLSRSSGDATGGNATGGSGSGGGGSNNKVTTDTKRCKFLFQYRASDPILSNLLRLCRVHLHERPGEVLLLFVMTHDGRRQLATNEDVLFAIEFFSTRDVATLELTILKGSKKNWFPVLIAASTVMSALLRILLCSARLGNLDGRVQLLGMLLIICFAMQIIQNILISIYLLRRFITMDPEYADWAAVSTWEQRIGIVAGAFNVSNIEILSSHVSILGRTFSKALFGGRTTSTGRRTTGGTGGRGGTEMSGADTPTSPGTPRNGPGGNNAGGGGGGTFLLQQERIKFTAPLKPLMLDKIRKYSFLGFLIGDLVPFIIVAIETILRRTYRDPFVVLSTFFSIVSVSSILVRHGVIRFVVDATKAHHGMGGATTSTTPDGQQHHHGSLSSQAAASPMSLQMSRKVCSILRLSLADESYLLSTLPLPLIERFSDTFFTLIVAPIMRRFGGVVVHSDALTHVVVFGGLGGGMGNNGWGVSGVPGTGGGGGGGGASRSAAINHAHIARVAFKSMVHGVAKENTLGIIVEELWKRHRAQHKFDAPKSATASTAGGTAASGGGGSLTSSMDLDTKGAASAAAKSRRGAEASKELDAVVSEMEKSILSFRHRLVGSIVSGEMCLGYIGTLTNQTFQHVDEYTTLSQSLCRWNSVLGTTLLCNELAAESILREEGYPGVSGTELGESSVGSSGPGIRLGPFGPVPSSKSSNTGSASGPASSSGAASSSVSATGHNACARKMDMVRFSYDGTTSSALESSVTQQIYPPPLLEVIYDVQMIDVTPTMYYAPSLPDDLPPSLQSGAGGPNGSFSVTSILTESALIAASNANNNNSMDWTGASMVGRVGDDDDDDLLGGRSMGGGRNRGGARGATRFDRLSLSSGAAGGAGGGGGGATSSPQKQRHLKECLRQSFQQFAAAMDVLFTMKNSSALARYCRAYPYDVPARSVLRWSRFLSCDNEKEGILSFPRLLTPLGLQLHPCEVNPTLVPRMCHGLQSMMYAASGGTFGTSSPGGSGASPKRNADGSPSGGGGSRSTAGAPGGLSRSERRSREEALNQKSTSTSVQASQRNQLAQVEQAILTSEHYSVDFGNSRGRAGGGRGGARRGRPEGDTAGDASGAGARTGTGEMLIDL